MKFKTEIQSGSIGVNGQTILIKDNICEVNDEAIVKILLADKRFTEIKETKETEVILPEKTIKQTTNRRGKKK